MDDTIDVKKVQIIMLGNYQNYDYGQIYYLPEDQAAAFVLLGLARFCE